MSFLDDGSGMDPTEVAKLIQFGSSFKRGQLDRNLIGQYGNGLKSGSMRIGNDMILFTKKKSTMSICFLSKTFFEREKLSDIIVPMPSFYVDSKQPWLENIKDDRKIQQLLEKHKIELDIILKHSPYKTNAELFAEFNKIKTSSGTLVTIYNLKLNIEGVSELDFITDKFDIQMSDLEVDFDRKRQYEHKSFRHYVSILYLDPNMKIYIQNKKVRTKMLDRCLYLPFVYSHVSSTFKKNAEKEVTKCENELKRLETDLLEANSKLQDYINKNSSKPSGYHTELTVLRRKKEELESSIEQKKLEVSIKKKSSKEPKKLELIFGINLHNRNADGLFLYNGNRLISMFEQTKLQQKDNEYRGIVGIVNIPYLVLEPTHNKQGFQEQAELTRLLKVLSEHMEQYSKDLNQCLDHKFWKKFGYSRTWNEMPLNEENFLKNRISYTKLCFQCDKCLIWREEQLTRDYLADFENCPPDNWSCKDAVSGDFECNKPSPLEEHKEMKLHQPKSKQIEEISSAATSSASSSLARSSFNSFQKKTNNDIIQKIMNKEAVSIRKSFDDPKRLKENRSLSASSVPKQKRKSQDNDEEDEDDEDVEDFEDDNNKARAKVRHRSHKNADNNYRNIHVDRNRSAAKKAKSDQLEVVTERVSSSVVKDEPESQEYINRASYIPSADDLIIESEIFDSISNYQNGNHESSSIEETQNQLIMLTKIADNFKNLLIALTSTYPETAKLNEEITNFNEKDLCSLSLNDLMESFREAAKNERERERERVKNILKAAEQDSAEQIIKVIYPTK